MLVEHFRPVPVDPVPTFSPGKNRHPEVKSSFHAPEGSPRRLQGARRDLGRTCLGLPLDLLIRRSPGQEKVTQYRDNTLCRPTITIDAATARHGLPDTFIHEGSLYS